MFDPSLFSLLLAVSAAGHSAADVRPQFEQWERRLRAKVASLHVIPADAQPSPACDVVVRFAVAEDGRAEGAVVRESSCGRYWERRALRLVRDLGRIGAIPSVAGHGHGVVLRLTYGTFPDASADRQLSKALETERNAHARRNIQIVSGWKSAER
ncbi:MAG TPA: hypothetical protein VEB39_04295 [Sphingomicrobium sp.]|nr:hypothetical protein [Sphingomicrobium sp.]